MLNYVSLIIDIENSRRYSIHERNSMQEFIVECMERLNKVFEKSLEFKMVFSAGDEVQGLFKNVTAAILYMRIFEMMIQPVKLRAGIGMGEWNIKIEDGISTQQDGPVYHRARNAIEEVKKMQTQRYRINSENNDDLVNNLLNASCILKEKQGYMQNIAQIIMELLYPFEKEADITYNYDIIRELLDIKYRYRIGAYYKRMTGKIPAMQVENAEELNRDKLKIVEPIYIDGKNFASEEVIIKKNMSSNIAEVIGCKRQNADMLIKRGNTIAIRNMDYVALQYIEREYRQYDV